jgi:hypothetical protein
VPGKKSSLSAAASRFAVSSVLGLPELYSTTAAPIKVPRNIPIDRRSIGALSSG